LPLHCPANHPRPMAWEQIGVFSIRSAYLTNRI
jgi:hypothetical protein